MALHRLFEHPITDDLTRRTAAAGREDAALGEATTIREPRAESREPRAESREPRAESREPRAESREPRAESREPLFYFAPGCTMPRLAPTSPRQPRPPESPSPARASRGDRLRRNRCLARFAAATLTTLLLAGAGLALAQVLTTYVSNLGETRTGNVRDILAQSFTTGRNTRGYTLSEVQLSLNGGTSTAVVAVQVKEDNSGAPGNVVASLSDPVANGVEFPVDPNPSTFTAPVNTRLAANTTYWVVVNELRPSGHDNQLRVYHTDSDDESGETTTGWSIGNGSLTKPTASDAWTTQTRSLKIAVKGAATPVTSDVTSDATVSTIKLTGTRLNKTLRPQHLVADTYTGFINHSVSTLTVAPRTSDTGATVEYFDASDAALTDTDTSTDALDIAVAEGLNVVKVKVTASDTVTSRTYTLRIVRAHGAPVQDANAALTSYVTATVTDRFKGFYGLGGRTSGWMSNRWVDRDKRVRVDALMTVERSFRSSDGERFSANTVVVCFIISAQIGSDDSDGIAGFRFDVEGHRYGLGTAREVPGPEKCYEWARPSGVSWTLGQLVRVRVYKDGDIAGGPNNPATGEPRITGTTGPIRVGTLMLTNVDEIRDRDGTSRARATRENFDGDIVPIYPGNAFSYQWFEVNGEVEEEIPGQTFQSYFAFSSDDAGKTLKVRVDFRDDRGFMESVTSAPVTIPVPSYSGGAVRQNEEVLWAATLTPVETVAGTTGCDNTKGSTKSCENVGILEENDGQTGKYKGESRAIKSTPGEIEDFRFEFVSLYRTRDQLMSRIYLIVGDKRLPLDGHKTGPAEFVWPSTGITLAAGTPVEVKLVGPGVTATLEQGPTRTERTTRPIYRFDLKVNRPVTISDEDLADHAFDVTNGSIHKVTRVGTQGSEGHWIVQVDATSTGDKVILEVEPKACHEEGAICTYSGGPLVNKVTVETEEAQSLVPTIADASGEEDDGYIDFPVTLGRTSDYFIEIDYDTFAEMGSKKAEAGADFYPKEDHRWAEPWLVFAPGETTQTIRVRLVNDTVEDSGETFKVRLRRWRAVDPTGRRKKPIEFAAIIDDSATGTIMNHEATGTMQDSDSSASTPSTGPTVTFGNVPESHGGESFSFALAFGEEFGMTAEALRGAFEVTNGRIGSVERVEAFVNRHWTVTVVPDGSDDVTVALDPAADCTASGALCTEDNRAIAESVSVEVPESAPVPDTPPLTAAFVDVPTHHGGGEFTFELRFSETPHGGFSYKTLQGTQDRSSVIAVVGGAVKRASRIEGNLRWTLRIAPDADAGDVTVTLPATTDCAATGAICTGDARALSAPASVTVPQTAPVQTPPVSTTPLTVSFETAPPAEHDGSGGFTFRIAFSENLHQYSYATLRDTSLTVMQGDTRLTPTKVKRTYASDASRVNRIWDVTVAPQSKASLAIALGPSPACTEAGAMCTEDGRALSNTLSATVLGPPGLSVADATVTEAEGATLDFVVSLSRASVHAITVAYATSEDTATAGADYTTASGTLTFSPGETAHTVEVEVIDDGHDDAGETMTLTLSNAQGGNAYITDAVATGTIENADHMPRAWLARFGRTVAGQVVGAVEGRFGEGRTPGVHVSVAGRTLGGRDDKGAFEPRGAGAGEQPLSAWLTDGAQLERGPGLGESGLSLQEVLRRSAFTATAGSADGGYASVWGRGAASGFDGRDGEMTVTGDVGSAMLGADVTRDAGMAGLMLMLSSGKGEYDGDDEGDVESTLTGLYPYARYVPSERLALWGVAGYGEGTFTLTPKPPGGGGEAIETDIDLMMGALGVRGMARDAPAQGGLEVAVTSDALAVRTTSQGTTGLMGAEADVTRLRFGVEGTWRGLGTGGGGGVTPRLEVGVRHDGGDAERGVGADIGAGVAWTSPASGLSGELSARGLLTHEADGFRERGVAGRLAWDPRPESDRGFTATLRQSLGAGASGGMDALFGHRTMADLAGEGTGIDDARRLELTLGYGLGVFGDRFTATPELGVGVSDTHRELRLGWRLGDAGGGPVSMALGVEGTRREGANDEGEAEHALMLRGAMRW